jgi:predicted nucleic acid-binding protein
VSSSAAYLLDVNVLLAFGIRQHLLHRRVSTWVLAGQFSALMTCSITELGFVRIASKAYGMNVEQASALLSFVKVQTRFPTQFLSDDQDATYLPQWVKTSDQTTDGHLIQLAQAHGAVLATLDAKIPGAFVIP